MIRQYKLREINRAPELHKEVFVLAADFRELLEKVIVTAIEAGADKDTLKGLISDEED
jgi:hypothetical protein